MAHNFELGLPQKRAKGYKALVVEADGDIFEGAQKTLKEICILIFITKLMKMEILLIKIYLKN